MVEQRPFKPLVQGSSPCALILIAPGCKTRGFVLRLKAVELVKRVRQKTTRYAGGDKGLHPNQNTFPIECECSSHILERKGVLYGQ